MVQRRSEFYLLDLKHASFIIFGFIFNIVYYTTAATVSCKSSNISSTFNHCEPDEAHDLHCYGNHANLTTLCEWKPGNHTREKNYTLIIRQPDKKYCKVYRGMTGFNKIIRWFENNNVSAVILENVESRNCTKAFFSGSPKQLLRCAPPNYATFRRKQGKLYVNVNWEHNDAKAIAYYSVRYKPADSNLWSQLLVQSENTSWCTVENLTSSKVYTVQIRCVTNDKCTQCPWSRTYIVPSELTTKPVDVGFRESRVAVEKGRRVVSLKWKFPATEPSDGYYVTVAKASGEEPREFELNTTEPEISLILSYSAYRLNIRAFNNVSTSPEVNQTIPQPPDFPGVADGKLNITVHSKTSFTIYWGDDLIKNYVCYSVEWNKNGHKSAHLSFYQGMKNSRTLTPLPEPLEPFKRYTITLHTRPNKETCNMKYVNNSESTYGTTQFYFIEGSPVSAPNISYYNMTLTSVILQWESIPEDDMRGFLLGYIIYFSEYRGTSVERNVTVGAEFNTYKLENLKTNTAYQVQISGFTKAGPGVRSKTCPFKTNRQGYFGLGLSSVLVIFAVVVALLLFGSLLIKRAKAVLWPSIPNPGMSDAMLKIEGVFEMELLESISALRVEEWDTNSLQIVEKEPTVLPFTLPSVTPLLHFAEDEADSSEIICNWFQTDAEDAIGGGDGGDDNAGTLTDTRQTNFQSFPSAIPSEYTTMAMFQQMMPQCVLENKDVAQDSDSDPVDNMTVVKSRFDYVRQFSTSPVLGDEEISIS